MSEGDSLSGVWLACIGASMYVCTRIVQSAFPLPIPREIHAATRLQYHSCMPPVPALAPHCTPPWRAPQVWSKLRVLARCTPADKFTIVKGAPLAPAIACMPLAVLDTIPPSQFVRPEVIAAT